MSLLDNNHTKYVAMISKQNKNLEPKHKDLFVL